MDGLGRFMIFFGQQFTRMESFRTYVRRVIDESVIIGYNSVFLFAIIATFMGAVTTLQTAYNLVSPLVPVYIVSVVVRDMTLLELAPTIMAIVFAGKVGSNIAGELGTMRITEQIDALEVMGINATSYLVLPKIIAAIITYPMLVILSGFLTITGGYLISIVTGVLTGTEYIYGIRYEFVAFNVSFALIKSVTFGFLVAAISAYKGFYTNGGALEVGKSSTSAVNNSCIAILVADYVLAQLLI